jgi:hypothetical protein
MEENLFATIDHRDRFTGDSYHKSRSYLHGTKRSALRDERTTSSRRTAACSISSKVFSSPNESLIEQWDSCSDNPMANNTCEGFGDPDLHADPEERHTPF